MEEGYHKRYIIEKWEVLTIVQSVVQTKLGPVSILIDEGAVVKISLGRIFDVPTENIQPFKRIVEDYFAGKLKKVDFPVRLEGTEFQKRVWKEVRKIPYGEVRTYGWIAKMIGTSPRAVGMAMKRNNIPLYIPCHRVVAKRGIGGFSSGFEWKVFLLELEGVVI